MANKTLNAKIKQRIDTTANWNNNSNIILENGEIGFERTAQEEIKAKIGDGIHTWNELSYIFNTITGSDSSSSSNNNQYIGGEGIEITNNTISSTYGTFQIQNDIMSFNNDQQNLIIVPYNEDFGINLCLFKIPEEKLNFIEHPFNVILKENNTIIKTMPVILNDYTIYPGTQNASTIPTTACGSEFFAEAIFSEGEDENAIEALTQENLPDNWWIFNIDVNKISQGYGELVFIAHNSILSSNINNIDIECQIEKIKKIPFNALNANKGIEITENSTVQLKYGQSDKDVFNGDFLFDFGKTDDPSSYYFGNLYAYFNNYSEIHKLEPNTYPNPILNDQFKKYKILVQDNLTSISSTSATYKTTIDYNNDSYLTMPLYFYDKNNEIRPAQPNLVLKELPYNNNNLYTQFSAGLDNENPSNNIFFANVLNSNDDVFSIINNGTVSSLDSNPALLFIFLWNSKRNTGFLLIFSNNNDLSDSLKNYQAESGNYEKEWNVIPYDIFNGKNNIDYAKETSAVDSPAKAIILGENNTYYTKGHNMLLIGDNNDLVSNYATLGINNTPYLVLGNHLNLDSSGSAPYLLLGDYNAPNYFSSSEIPYLIIGNGTSSEATNNIFSVTSQGVYVNGQNITSTNNDYVTTNDLPVYLNNNGYVTNADLSNILSNGDYVTTGYLNNNDYITTTSLSNYLIGNGYVTNTELSNRNYLTPNTTTTKKYLMDSNTIKMYPVDNIGYTYDSNGNVNQINTTPSDYSNYDGSTEFIDISEIRESLETSITASSINESIISYSLYFILTIFGQSSIYPSRDSQILYYFNENQEYLGQLILANNPLSSAINEFSFQLPDSAKYIKINLLGRIDGSNLTNGALLKCQGQIVSAPAVTDKIPQMLIPNNNRGADIKIFSSVDSQTSSLENLCTIYNDTVSKLNQLIAELQEKGYMNQF